MTDEIKIGDRVRDKLKEPKPGDKCTTGVVVAIFANMATVKWDQPLPFGGDETDKAIKILEKI